MLDGDWFSIIKLAALKWFANVEDINYPKAYWTKLRIHSIEVSGSAPWLAYYIGPILDMKCILYALTTKLMLKSIK